MLLTSYVTHRCVFEMHDVDYDYEYKSRQSVLTNILSIGCYHLPVCTCKIQDEEIPTDAKLAFFNETRHAYGRSALLLSGTIHPQVSVILHLSKLVSYLFLSPPITTILS